MNDHPKPQVTQTYGKRKTGLFNVLLGFLSPGKQKKGNIFRRGYVVSLLLISHLYRKCDICGHLPVKEKRKKWKELAKGCSDLHQ